MVIQKSSNIWLSLELMFTLEMILLSEKVHRGHIEVVKFLVEHGADIHAEYDCALYVSVDNGNMLRMELILMLIMIIL